MNPVGPVTSFERKLMKRIIAQEKGLSEIFNQFIRSVSPQLSKYRANDLVVNDIWIRNKAIERSIDNKLRLLQSSIQKYMSQQTLEAWGLANERTDIIVEDYIKKLSISDAAKQGLFVRNINAYEAFTNRKLGGMGLSDRVWKICSETKQQLEMYLDSGLSVGRSASEIARDVNAYLKDPDKTFRRVRDPKTGKLKPSKPMADYHPGQGKHRSAYRNALRVTRTETNMAYRLADQERWKKIDFIGGYEVKLSASHPVTDICDAMVGEYPKNFVFSGWHPNCYCYCVPVLLTQDEFVEYLHTDKMPDTKKIKGIPPAAVKYVKDKSTNFRNYTNPPYWLKDNFAYRNGAYYPKAGIKKPKTKPSSSYSEMFQG